MKNRRIELSEEIKLSVIVPVYNAQEEIKYLLEDIQNQSLYNFEAIVVDDGSEDNSGAICKEYSRRDERYIYIYQKNEGVSSARNHGLDISKGRYITFLDADDRIPADRFEKMVRAIEQKDTNDLVIGRYRVDIKSKKFPFSSWQSDLMGEQNLDVLIKDYEKSMSGFYYGVIWNKLYKRSIITKYDIKFDESISWGEDLIFNLQYFCHIKNCVYISDYIYNYCYTESSLLSNITIYEDKIDFMRYKKVLELGEKLYDKQDYTRYLRTANEFFLERVIRKMSMKVVDVSFCDIQAYDSFKEYILLPEVVSLWKQDDLFKDNIAYCLIQKLILKKEYHIVYYLFVLKEKIKKRNKIWNLLKKIIFK